MIDHYEVLFDSTYLRWFNLCGEPALVEIAKVERRELTLRGGAKKKAPVIEIKQVQGSIDEVKPLVLNRTNADEIARIHGNQPTLWIGKQIVLTQEETQLKGKTVNCIRVRAKKETK